MTIRLTALVGFSQFETLTLESFFRLAGRRAPGYSIVTDPAAAHVLIVNADEAARVQALWAQGPQAKVVLIGASDFGTNWPSMPRPIRLLAVLEKIEELLRNAPLPQLAAAPAAVVALGAITTPAPLGAAPSASATAAVSTPAPKIAAPLPPASPPAAVPPAQTPPSLPAAPQIQTAAVRAKSGASGFGNSVGFSNPNAQVAEAKPPAEDDDLILVVDDSDIVLRFMQGRLQRFGFSVALASTGEKAVEMANVRNYKFVFLDVMMPGIDGYQTCRLIKKIKAPNGAAPVVVMLSSRGGTIDKIRGTLAGADAYLTKPLAEAALVKVLADHDTQTAASFSNTRAMSEIT